MAHVEREAAATFLADDSQHIVLPTHSLSYEKGKRAGTASRSDLEG